MIIGSSTEHHEIVSSTNSVIAGKLKNTPLQEGYLITASFQESGRGQQGNTWESEAGKNLLMSTIIYPTMVSPEEQFLISQMASLAVYDLLKNETRHVKIKWPNDIYVRNDKIAGILIENSLIGNSITSSIIGIGLNLNQKSFSDLVPNAVSLTQITGRVYDVNEISVQLAGMLDSRYRMIRNSESLMLHNDYLLSLYRYHEWCRYKDDEGEFTGVIEDVRTGGMLIVRRRDGRVKEYSFKEIEYLF